MKFLGPIIVVRDMRINLMACANFFNNDDNFFVVVFVASVLGWCLCVRKSNV